MNSLVVKRFIDYYSLIVAIIMIAGLTLLFFATAHGNMNPVLACALATFFMNLSFTAWHESCHGNLSNLKFLNNFVGIFSSFFSLYPGYFSRKREHLAHHRYEGDRDKDPVYPRIQANFWFFPFRLVHLMVLRKNSIPKDFMPMSRIHKTIDITTILLVIVCGIFLIDAGWTWAFLCVFILPRAIIFAAHAYYICFFPHAKDGGGYELYRIVSKSWILYWLTMAQSLHGVHHRWPNLPWHEYHKKKSELL